MKANIITILLALAGVACAGEMKLLNDHLRITVPDEAEYFIIPTWTVLDRSDEQTGVIIPEGADECIDIIAEEEHCLADDDFVEGVKTAMASLNSEHNDYDIVQVGDNLVYALLREDAAGAEDAKAGKSGAPLAYAQYRHPDGTVQKFTVLLISPRPTVEVKKYREQVRQWLNSIKPGGTPLKLQERVEHLSFMKDCSVAVPVPQGYYSVVYKVDGLRLGYYGKLQKRGETDEIYCVYVSDEQIEGFHEIPDGQQTTQNGTLLGKKVEWHLYQPEEGVKRAECVLPLGCRGDDVTFSEEGEDEIIYLHITIYAKDAESCANLIRQAEKISLEKA